MIIPTKHTKLANSILGIGSEILKKTNDEQTVSSLWENLRDSSEINSFEQFILGLDFLFILGVVEFKDGLLVRVGK